MSLHQLFSRVDDIYAVAYYTSFEVLAVNYFICLRVEGININSYTRSFVRTDIHFQVIIYVCGCLVLRREFDFVFYADRNITPVLKFADVQNSTSALRSNLFRRIEINLFVRQICRLCSSSHLPRISA